MSGHADFRIQRECETVEGGGRVFVLCVAQGLECSWQGWLLGWLWLSEEFLLIC